MPLGKLGDFVWNDLNTNGIQDSGEPGMPNLPLQLLAPGADNACGTGDEVFIKSTTAGANGQYEFLVGTPSTYCLRFEPLPGHVISPPNQGDGANDSKPSPNTGQTPVVPLGRGGANLNQDAGIVTAIFGDNRHARQWRRAGRPPAHSMPVRWSS